MTDILIVEDNKELGELLADFLVKDGYSCHNSLSGEDALSYISDNPVRLVLLDIMLPGIDGFNVCRKIRSEQDTPILIISAKIEKEDKLNGLLLGADDYIEKPYDVDILIAKIKGIFKRNYEDSQTGIITDGNIKVDKIRRATYLCGNQLTLTAKEYELLILLLENKGKALKKEWIFNRIWGFDSFSEPSTLTVHIKWLRQKIENDPKNPERLLTVWGVGYRFE